MDLNAVFTSTTPYRSATTQTSGEHALFVGVEITPVHGWLIGPEGPEYAAIKRMDDYKSAINLIVEADLLTSSLFFGTGYVESGDACRPLPSYHTSSSSTPLTSPRVRGTTLS